MNLAAAGQETGRRRLGRGDDLVVREHAATLLGAVDLLLRDPRAGAVGADHGAGAQALCLAGTVDVDDGGAAVGIVFDALEAAAGACCAMGHGALAQPLVEVFAVDHADAAAFDRDVDLFVARRDHARRMGAGDQHRFGNREVCDQPRRDRTAAGFDAPCPIEQQHAMAGAGQVIGGGGAGRATTDDDGVVVQGAHACTSRFVAPAGLRATGAAGSTPAASCAAHRNSKASSAKTIA